MSFINSSSSAIPGRILNWRDIYARPISAGGYLVKANKRIHTCPAAILGKERGLVSRTAAGNPRVLRARYARFLFRVRE